MAVQIMNYKLLTVGLSDVGLVRENNEDVWAEEPKQRFFVLADGMGGHQAGEVAAKETVRKLCSIVSKKARFDKENYGIDDARNLILSAIKETNTYINDMGKANSDLKGMGTTLCCLHFHPKGLIYAHVGDSRIYRFRGKKLFQMTKDHSLLRELLDLGQLSERQAEEFMYKNIITKAVGTEVNLEPTVRLSDILDRDIYLLCSDGLSDMLSREEIESEMNRPNLSLDEMAQNLIHAAKQKGGYDNITIVLVKVEESHAGKNLSR
jgi:protein phosphatase